MCPKMSVGIGISKTCTSRPLSGGDGLKNAIIVLVFFCSGAFLHLSHILIILNNLTFQSTAASPIGRLAAVRSAVGATESSPNREPATSPRQRMGAETAKDPSPGQRLARQVTARFRQAAPQALWKPLQASL